MTLIPYFDESSTDLQTKANQLRDMSQIDIQVQLKLWHETLHLRRQSVRNQPTDEILKNFPGYSSAILVNKFLYSQFIMSNLFFVIGVRRSSNAHWC